VPGPIAEFEDVGRERFRDAIAPLQQPAVLRGLVRGWPAVGAGLESPQAIAAYLGAMDSGAAVESLRTPPSARGRIFYNEALDGFNYVREKATIGSVLERLARYAAQQNPASIAVQSAPIAECLPGFLAENANPLLDPGVAPRIWIGNHVVTPAHFDESSNIACVVSGRRRFTLFAPSQIANLYIGPLGYAPTGTPISLVDFAAPDARRFPRFADAIANAQVAELDPGDAIYIPPLWWHHVESLAKMNVLVNYWWNEGTVAPGRTDSALDALLLAILDLRHLPPAQRRAWGAIFEHYVFGPGEAAAQHIPAHRRGVLGEIPPELARQVREFLLAKLRGP
jgi:hypothetical protein